MAPRSEPQDQMTDGVLKPAVTTVVIAIVGMRLNVTHPGVSFPFSVCSTSCWMNEVSEVFWKGK